MIHAISMLLGAMSFEPIWNADIWYALPAIISISLVYSATRNEEMGAILRHAIRTGLWITGFMAAFFLILSRIS